MRPSVMIDSLLTGCRPFARSTVSTVSRPRPENATGRRIRRHWTSGRSTTRPVRIRFSRYWGSQRASFDDATTAWLRWRAAACASVVWDSGCSNGSACGT